jgi:Zn-dependent protease
LPENHACPRVGGAKQPGYASVAPPGPRYPRRDRSSGVRVRSGWSRFRLRYPSLFSSVERKHIAVATVLMVLVGLFWRYPYQFTTPLIALVIACGVLLSFLGHELSHKFFAQRNGLWAEFRTNIYLLALTAISIPFFFKFLVPGQTNIIGNGSKELTGAIALIGPGFNIVLGIIFYLSRIFFALTSFAVAFSILAQLNALIAVLNLIPFPGFDGMHAFDWDRTRWAVAFVASIALTVIAYVRP